MFIYMGIPGFVVYEIVENIKFQLPAIIENAFVMKCFTEKNTIYESSPML